MSKFALLIFASLVTTVGAAPRSRLQSQAGVSRSLEQPGLDSGSLYYQTREARVGVFTATSRQGAIVSYAGKLNDIEFDVGQRERSLDTGFLVGNGAYLPWTHNLPGHEPIGSRLGVYSKYLGADVAYYQQDDQAMSLSRLRVLPTWWLKIEGGVGVDNPIENQRVVLPVMGISFGNSQKFPAILSASWQGEKNFLGYTEYRGRILFRALAFMSDAPSPLASGIYARKRGLAGQFISTSVFIQYFETDTRFGMARFEEGIFAAVIAHEERTQYAGLTLKTAAEGFHLRLGATVARDSSWQSLAGLGFGNLVFIGGGHFQLLTDQPLEPVIFPSNWYSSLLLQSSGMRIKHNGLKAMALVNSEHIKGFVALTHFRDSRQRENFGFYFRASGYVTF